MSFRDRYDMPFFAVMALWISLGVGAVLCGCESLRRASTPAPQPSAPVAKTAGDVKAAAGEIRKNAEAGQQATPPDLLPVLSRYWTAILTQCGMLDVSASQLDTLAGQVREVEGRLKASEARSSQLEERIKKNDEKHAKELAEANSSTKRMFDRLAWLSVVGIGVACAAAAITHRASIAVAGVAGGGVMLLVSLLTGSVLKLLPFVAGGLLVLGTVYLLAEWAIRWRKLGDPVAALRIALTTSPATDIRELAGGGTGG